MIQDLDGASFEPTRRGRVLVLSGAVAVVSLVLLVALVVPPVERGTPPQAASPMPSPSVGFSRTMVSNPLTNLPLDLTRSSVCPDGFRLTPPYYLAVDANTGRIFAGPFDGGPRLPVLVTLDLDAGTRKVTVTCATSAPTVVTGDMFGPWEFDER